MKLSRPLLGLGILFLLLVGAFGYVAYAAFTDLETKLAQEEARALSLEAQLADMTENATSLQEALASERARNEELTEDVHDLRGTVRKLDKIVSTDPELLQKYSKVYFLNENYSPASTTPLPDEIVSNGDEESIDARVYPFLAELIEDAANDDVAIVVTSGYRSFGTQAGLKSSYLVRYGTGANAFSADQGYSEHQLGTTVDFTTPVLGTLSTTFDQTAAFAWLQDNAYKYGFILSYPKGNGYYVYEPWHWRFVGRDLARKLHRDGTSFYDLDQREIDKYLGDLFE